VRENLSLDKVTQLQERPLVASLDRKTPWDS
jgi:hypothetical protein